jgi:hypothetical protein
MGRMDETGLWAFEVGLKDLSFVAS